MEQRSKKDSKLNFLSFVGGLDPKLGFAQGKARGYQGFLLDWISGNRVGTQSELLATLKASL